MFASVVGQKAFDAVTPIVVADPITYDSPAIVGIVLFELTYSSTKCVDIITGVLERSSGSAQVTSIRAYRSPTAYYSLDSNLLIALTDPIKSPINISAIEAANTDIFTNMSVSLSPWTLVFKDSLIDLQNLLTNIKSTVPSHFVVVFAG